MKSVKKILCVLLTLTIVASCVAIGSMQSSAVTDESAVGESQSGLAQETVQGSAILHCFCWSYDTIRQNLTDIKAAGYTAVQLSQCRVLISEDEKIDMAFIETGEKSVLISDKAQVLDDVLVMGYPRIPQFFDFCAAERATISSIATMGAVASLADQYITPSVGQLMLVTARIRRGNSGGPIINSDGAVVGVAFAESDSEGDYDEMGYGVAYPISVFYQMLQDSKLMNVKFVDEVK